MGAGSGATSGGVSSIGSTGGMANRASVEQMTEEEQLQAAIRASMNEASGMNQSDGGNDDDNDDHVSDENDVYIMEDSDDDNDDDGDHARDTTMDMEDDEELKVETVKELTFHDEIVNMDVGEEPSGTDGARIMIRMPDGKRLVRKFNVEDTVKIVYAFVAVSLLLCFALPLSIA
jgi:hypothetical protein